MSLSKLLRPASRALSQRVLAPTALRALQRPSAFLAARAFASQSAAVAKLSQSLEAELKYEKENSPEEAKAYDDMKAGLAASGWNLQDTPGDVNLALVKELPSGKEARIEWQGGCGGTVFREFRVYRKNGVCLDLLA